MTRGVVLQVATALAFCVGFPTGVLSGGLENCVEGSFTVDAPSEKLDVEICRILNETALAMSLCGLTQSKPIAVSVVDTIEHPIGQCLAYFDCDDDTIEVTNPASYADLLSENDPYSLLPPEILLRALLTHELAHALTEQSALGRRVDIVDQEYIAAALELELLGERWRSTLVEASPVSLPPKRGLIDIWIYGMAPRKFATNAWQHFRQEGNGCGLIKRIVEGQFSFKN